MDLLPLCILRRLSGDNLAALEALDVRQWRPGGRSSLLGPHVRPGIAVQLGMGGLTVLHRRL
eukprot:6390675-Pyramimonas_sp.AAC.1